MDLASNLRERRERLSLTQERVANALGIPRELVSFWETGVRTPSFKYLQALAKHYSTTPEHLLGNVEASDKNRPLGLFRGVPENDHVNSEVQRWIAFLDTWAEFQEEDIERDLPGPSRPPRHLDQGATVHDARRASALADEVREFYRLGQDALPNLYAFLDEQGILVYKANLGSIGVGSNSISGAFCNHPKLGYCILVNADTTPGRQAFTLAHELAHALFHHAEGGILCRFAADDRLERFADAFAANFLVPGKELRRLVKSELERRDGAELQPPDAISLANYFGVSYAMILVRLLFERLISREVYDAWKRISAAGLAEQLGLNSDEFRIPEPKTLSLDRYPLSVLEETRWAVEQGYLSPKQAAGLLEVSIRDVQGSLLAPPPAANEREELEHAEFKVA